MLKPHHMVMSCILELSTFKPIVRFGVFVSRIHSLFLFDTTIKYGWILHPLQLEKSSKSIFFGNKPAVLFTYPRVRMYRFE